MTQASFLSSTPGRFRDGRGTPLPDGRLRLGYIVPPSAQFAGIERVVHEVASVLARDYHRALDVSVISCSRYDGVTPANVPYTLHHIDAGRLRGVFTRLRRFLSREPFDVLVVAQCETTTLAWLAARLSGPAGRQALIIPHLHGNPSIEATKSLTNRVLFGLYRSLVAPSVGATLAVSPALAERVRDTRLAGGHPVYYAPNPARTFEETRSERREGDPPVFACVGRLTRQKGQDILLRAFAQVLRHRPDSRLDLVGGGEDEGMLRALASELGIEGRVVFHGHLADPSPILRQASAFVGSSRWEGFHLALVEALEFGLPLVSADCDFGPSDIITDERIGRLVRPEDPDALARAMLDALETGRSYDADAYRRAQAALFAPEAAARVHARILAEVVAAERGPTPASLLTARVRREA